jgi:hypothetical protein
MLPKFNPVADKDLFLAIVSSVEKRGRNFGTGCKATCYEGISKSFRTVRLERELQMVQFSATRCSCIAILWVSLVSFAAITLCVASGRVFIVVRVYFLMDSVRKLLDTSSYALCSLLHVQRIWIVFLIELYGKGGQLNRVSAAVNLKPTSRNRFFFEKLVVAQLSS